jgi:hypothetical protein
MNCDVRFTLESGNAAAAVQCPLSANRVILNRGKTASLFDQLVGALLEEQRHVEAERLGGLEVDRKLELGWGLNGKLARLLALEDAIGIGGCAPKIIEPIISVG